MGRKGDGSVSTTYLSYGTMKILDWWGELRNLETYILKQESGFDVVEFPFSLRVGERNVAATIPRKLSGEFLSSNYGRFDIRVVTGCLIYVTLG